MPSIGCCGIFADEFQLKNLKLKMAPEELAAFGDSAMIGNKNFSYYRAVIAVYIVALFFWSTGENIEAGTYAWWWCYLTHWTLTVEAAYLILAAVVSFQMDKIRAGITDKKAEYADPPKLVLVTWVLMDVVYCNTFLVFLMYWLLVYDGDTNAVSVQVHGVNFLLMAVDVFLSGAPLRVLHLWVPMLYGTAYLLFNYFYYLGGGGDSAGDPYIYSTMDWGNAYGTALFWGLVLPYVLLPLFHTLLWFWWLLGNYVSKEDASWRASLLESLDDTTAV